MGRLIISKQLEQAAGQYYTVESDISGNLQFVLSSALVEANETTLVVTTDGDGTGVSHSGTNDHTVDITLLSGDANNALSTGGDGGVFLSQLKIQTVVADIAERDALSGNLDGDLVFVQDASDDGTVTAGWALYLYDSGWTKVAEEEGVDPTSYSFIISDGTTTQTINTGNTLLFNQGEGILADVVATDQLNLELRRNVEEFVVDSGDGDTVTLAGTPPTNEDFIEITRNGIAIADADWSILGSVITFADSFGGSTGGTDSETIIVRYFEG